LHGRKPGYGEEKSLIQTSPIGINFTENMLFGSCLVEKRIFPEKVAPIDWCGAAVAIRGVLGALHTQSTSQKQRKPLVTRLGDSEHGSFTAHTRTRGCQSAETKSQTQ
jgi:hypothetical protein